MLCSDDADIVFHFFIAPATFLLEELEEVHLLCGFGERAVAEHYAQGVCLCDGIDDGLRHSAVEASHEAALIHVVDGATGHLLRAVWQRQFQSPPHHAVEQQVETSAVLLDVVEEHIQLGLVIVLRGKGHRLVVALVWALDCRNENKG